MTNTNYPLADFRIGGILRKTWAQIRARPAALAVITIAGWLPNLATEQSAIVTKTFAWFGLQAPPFVSVIILLTIVGICSTFSAGITALLVVPAAFGAETSLRDAIVRGLSHPFSLIATIFLMSLGVMVGAVLVIPGVILFATWAVAIPACACERLGPIRALGRSAQLTSGFRWRILALLLSYLVLGVALTAMLYASSENNLSEIGPWIGGVLDLSFTMAFNVGTAVAYRELRAIKDGIDLSEVSAVFD
jgi:hypothetical protein